MTTTELYRSALISLVLFVLTSSVQGRAEFDLNSGKGYQGQQATVNYAHCAATHRIGNIALAVNNNGTFGTGFRAASGADCYSGGEVLSCEYPKGSRVKYLFAGAFWVGAVVGRDTLVSLGADGWSSVREFRPDESPFGDMLFRSITDPNSPRYEGAVSEEDFICTYTDTFTEGIDADYFGRPHRPLYIAVEENSYAWSYAYAEDIVLFDYGITNVGTSVLEDVYMGIYVDADVGFDESSAYTDDLAGFLPELEREYGECKYTDVVNLAWTADNDGDLGFMNPAPHLTAMRIVRTPAEELNVSFNWWISNGNSSLDFGPRQKARLMSDGSYQPIEFRDFQTGGLGTPEGDRNKYHVLSNREFDYDQAKVSTIQPNNPEWLYPPQDQITEWAQGLDTRYLLSFGPFNIAPGQRLPLSFAYMGGENLHSDPANIDNLPGDPETYYANLDFSDLATNSTWASWIYDNPGVDTDGDGYAGEFRVCWLDSVFVDTTEDGDPDVWIAVVADTFWYLGDGIPDFRGAAPPPAPDFWIHPEVGRLRIRFNGWRSETTRDNFSRLVDFEGYRIYLGRDERATSYSRVTSWDREDYNKYVFDESRGGWVLRDVPFTLDQLRTIYQDSTLDPLDYTPSSPYVLSMYPDSQFYFEAQDYNQSDLGMVGSIRKRFPDQPYPSSLILDSVHHSELTEDGYLKYFEYEYVIEDLLPTVPYWVNVTAFDFGSPAAGLDWLETAVTIGAKYAYPLSSSQDALANNLEVMVYPNPYRINSNYRGTGFEGRVDPDRPDDRLRLIHFANLPPKCTISIFSIDGDLVKKIEHDVSPSDPNASHETWDLITRNTQLAVSGLYYWTVERPDGDTQIGKLVIIM